MTLKHELSIDGVFSYFEKNTLVNLVMKEINSFHIDTNNNGLVLELKIWQKGDIEGYSSVKDEKIISRFIDRYSGYKKNLFMGNIAD